MVRWGMLMQTDVSDRLIQAGGPVEDERSPGAKRLATLWRALRAWVETPSGRIWLDAGWIWLLSRTMFLALTFLVPGLLAPTGGAGGIAAQLDRWGSQDGGHFAYIAAHGYYPLWRTAFWPLFPALEHIIGPLTGGDYVIAGLLIANVTFFGTLVALRRLAERELGPEAARRAILYLAIFPTALYFFAAYSESLFLLLATTSFAALRERRWWLAGALGLLATLTRSAGVLLLVPYAVEWISALRIRKARWWDAGWAALIPTAAGIYSAYLYLNHRDPLAYIHSESFWGRSLQWPWTTYITGFQGLFGHAGASRAFGATHLALNLGALLVFAGLAAVALRMLPLSYGLYVAALVVYLSLFPAADAVAAVQGEARLVLMAFPAFMALGAWGRHRLVHEALLTLMLPMLALATAHFLLGLFAA
jgi:hypothetical protein